MNINKTLSNTANVLKTFAVRFFDLYFFIYAILVASLIILNKHYIMTTLLLSFFCCLRCYLKYKLNINRFMKNIGLKYFICLTVLLTTYCILCFLSNSSFTDIYVFSLCILVLISFCDTAIMLMSCLSQTADKFQIKDTVYIVKESDISVKLSELCLIDKKWCVDDYEKGTLADMLHEFMSITNEEQLGHVVVRSLTQKDENGTEKLCIKARNGYHIIVRGKYEHIISMCSDIMTGDKLLDLDDTTKENIKEQICGAESEHAEVVCCAFKEVNDISEEHTSDFIFTGYGIYDFDNSLNQNKLVITEVSKYDALVKCFGENVIISQGNIIDTIKDLHNENKYVCGYYDECDSLNSPEIKKMVLRPADNYVMMFNNIFFVLIAILLITSNIFMSLSDTVVFNSFEVLCAGLHSFIFSTALCLCGEYDNRINKYIMCLSGTITVLCSYFIGRYMMSNQEYYNDLFYSVTAGAMTTVTLIANMLLYTLFSIRYKNNKSVITATLIFIATIIYFFIPITSKVLEGYSISGIYIVSAILTAIISVVILPIKFYKRNKTDGK